MNSNQLFTKSPTANQKPSLVDFATPVSEVSAFCRAIIAKIVPNGFWGEGSEGAGNKEIVLHYIDRFVRLRRFENFSLHVVLKGFKVSRRTPFLKEWAADKRFEAPSNQVAYSSQSQALGQDVSF